MHKKLLAWVVALLIAALLAVPAFAQDISVQAGESPFTEEHCSAITADPVAQEMFYSIYPELADICG